MMNETNAAPTAAIVTLTAEINALRIRAAMFIADAERAEKVSVYGGITARHCANDIEERIAKMERRLARLTRSSR